ncbi:MAG: fibrillarin-like rRNA/tRNA 2'-O-methyltransferase, partial [Candidatus Micrarchaeota archaeon]
MKQLFPGIYSKNGRLYTLNAVKGFRVHGEHVAREGSKEYREWNPRQSKLAAAIVKGIKNMP